MEPPHTADFPDNGKNRELPVVQLPEMEIRTAGPEDAAAIARLSCQLGYPTSADQAGKRLEGILGSGDHAVFVAIVGDHVVGWIHIFLAQRLESNPFAELGGFVVAEPHRRRGLGRRLLASAEEWSVGRGVAKLRVRFRPERAEARKFYVELGFAMEKEQDVVYKFLRQQVAAPGLDSSCRE